MLASGCQIDGHFGGSSLVIGEALRELIALCLKSGELCLVVRLLSGQRGDAFLGQLLLGLRGVRSQDRCVAFRSGLRQVLPSQVELSLNASQLSLRPITFSLVPIEFHRRLLQRGLLTRGGFFLLLKLLDETLAVALPLSGSRLPVALLRIELTSLPKPIALSGNNQHPQKHQSKPRRIRARSGLGRCAVCRLNLIHRWPPTSWEPIRQACRK